MGIPTSAELEGQSLVLDVGSGVSIDALLRRLIPKGWFVPVTPGTAYVTLGGAIAADVHGKNHHRDGAFGSHVEQLTLVSADGPRELSPQRDPAMFWATVGGMGLTGVIARARVRLRAIESSSMTVDTLRASDLDACMAILAEADERYRYSVAWVDCSARGSRFGRSVVSLGEHATIDELPVNRRSSPREYVPGAVTRLPVSPPRNLVTRAAITAANEAWFRKAPRQRSGEVQTVRSFFYPLDALGGWNRLYGRRGFTQYQIVVPFGCEGVIAAVIARLQAAGMPSSLGVLKRFGASDDAPLSFPRPGWTLALDLAITPGLAAVLDELDELVARAEGRVYLAKDGRVRPELLQVMYPRIGEWLDVRDELDPGSVFVSDMWRRLCAGVGRDR